MGHVNARIQVVDRSGRVLLTVGDIQTATGITLMPPTGNQSSNPIFGFIQEKILNPVYYQILSKPSNDFFDELYSGVTREGAHIDAALQGEAITQFRSLANTQTRLLEAAHPILADGEILGAVVVDQNMNGLRTFRNQALETPPFDSQAMLTPVWQRRLQPTRLRVQGTRSPWSAVPRSEAC